MKETGVFFRELPVASEKGERETDEICRKIDETRYDIDGVEIGFPVEVGHAAMLLNAFLVDARKAQRMIEGSGYRIMEMLPGKTLLQLAIIDYRANVLGDYNLGRFAAHGT